jgi:hypothetical protein
MVNSSLNKNILPEMYNAFRLKQTNLYVYRPWAVTLEDILILAGSGRASFCEMQARQKLVVISRQGTKKF